MADLLGAIDAAEATAYSSDESGTLSEIRARSIDDYLGQPYGDEVEGQSQVVSRDVYDIVETVKPSLLRIFAGGDQVCAFDPIGPDDEAQAEQETDYINHIIQDKNDWFNICMEWADDGLKTKNAYAMAYWDDSIVREVDQYEGLDDNGLAMLVQDEWEIIEHSSKPDEQGMEQYQQMAAMAQQQGMEPPPPPQLHDVKVKREKPKNKVCIKVLPPERIKVAESTPNYSLVDCPYFEYWDYLTVSTLRSMGLEVTGDEASEDPDTPEDNSRDDLGEEENRNGEPTDPSMKVLKTRMIWIKCDMDEDGIAELIYCIRVGDKILYQQEVSRIPVASWVPIPLAHRHFGLSARDAITDIQRIKTVILRQALNNLYLQNNGRYGVSDKVNLDDMLTSRPGGLVRVQGVPSQEIFPFVHPTVTPQAMQFMEFMDQIKGDRAGVNRMSAGLDPKAIDANVGTIAQLTSAASQRLELIARVMANGVRELFHIVHEIILKHDHKTNVVKIKGKWVSVDPRSWKKRSDIRITVGVGAGNKEVMMQNLGMIAQYQEKGLMIGIATPQNLYNTATEMTKIAGFANSDRFWTQPPENPPPKTNPLVEAEMAKGQVQMQIKQVEAQADAQKTQFEAQQSEKELMLKAQLDRERMQAELALQATNDQRQAELDARKAAMDAQQAEREFQLDQWKAEKELEVKLYLEQLKAGLNAKPPTAKEQKKEPNEMLPVLERLNETLASLTRPKIATMSDGRKVRIDHG